MTALFYPPKFNSGLAFAKLTFTQTTTTTPQNVYTDVGLTVAHSNPVVADSAGVFAPIYLDPSLPSYRVKYETAAGVLIYQVDDVPSNQNKATSMRVESTTPEVWLYDTDGTSNHRKIRIRIAGNTFEISESNDAENAFTVMASAVGGALNLASGTTIGGAEIVTPVTGTFTGTLTGMTGSVTGTVTYMKVGTHVMLKGPGAGLSGTSNSTAMTMTGLPAAITPSTASGANGVCVVTDNGNVGLGAMATVDTLGVITFALGKPTAATGFIQFGTTSFTNAGGKGIGAAWAISYGLT